MTYICMKCLPGCCTCDFLQLGKTDFVPYEPYKPLPHTENTNMFRTTSAEHMLQEEIDRLKAENHRLCDVIVWMAKTKYTPEEESNGKQDNLQEEV